MADADWKKRIGIAINFSPETSDDESEGLNNLLKSPSIATPKILKHRESTNSTNSDVSSLVGNGTSDGDDCHSSLDASSTYLDVLINEYGDYGNTPPRTRIHRRARERRQREELWENKKSPKVIQAKTRRRNTLDSIYFTELIERSKLETTNTFPETNTKTESTVSNRDTTPNSRRNSKRSQKLLRDSERNLKQQIDEPIVGNVRHSMPPTLDVPDNERSESLPPMLMACQPAIKVETSKRFMSLSSKPVACKYIDKKKEHHPEPTFENNAICSQERINFYKTFSLLIRMGSPDKPPDKNQRILLSREEHVWQNELKDLIWLELQAWHADRSVVQQDQYICEKRESVHLLLDDIMNYRFTAKDLTCDHGPRATPCPREGCLSIFCKTYLEAQNTAMCEVEQLMTRLEAAEALYPSSKAFGLQHPLYRSASFVGRVKAMCLWYNMTKHHRLKLLILSKLLTFPKCGFRSLLFPGEHRTTDYYDDGVGSGSTSSGIATSSTHGSTDDFSHHDFFNFNRSGSVENGKKSRSNRNLSVHFESDIGGSPSDSNNSTASSHQSSSAWSDSGNSSMDEGHLDFYNVVPMSVFMKQTCPSNPYRKYIESVLKTKGLRKSLNFLDKLYRYVLHSAKISLEKPCEKSTSTPSNSEASSPSSGSEITIQENNEEELKRYGFWSEEAIALGLPSYRSWYLFLSRIPLDFIHEFIRMRLEQKPEQPSILSIRQLMRELKEGLMIAVLYRERYLDLVEKALWDCEDESLIKFREGVNEFDASIKSLLEVYLDYLKQWVQMVQQDSFQKNLLEEEWNFVKGTFPHIPGAASCAGESFCKIASSNLQVIGDSLCSIVEDLTKNIDLTSLSDKTESPKQIILSKCRDFQALLSQTRERALKAVAFAKSLRKDLEADSEQIINCCRITEAVAALKTNALGLGQDIRESLYTIEYICDVREMNELDDIDRAALQSRCREVIHLGYKFGFEYLKEAYRLVTGQGRVCLSRKMICFASLWMRFVKDRCDRGRGLRPRWANQGLDFLMTVCEPQNTACLNDEEFQALKNHIDECISHVIGVASPSSNGDETTISNGNGLSTLGTAHHVNISVSPIPSRKHRIMPPPFRTSKSLQDSTSTTPPPSAAILHGRASVSGPPLLHQSPFPIEHNSDMTDFVNQVPPAPRIQRVRWAVRSLDNEIEEHLRKNELIGNVTDVEYSDHAIRARFVNFSWQRGIKIGQGRFGKVYTAVNNKTGELMAMKEIQLQPNDHRTVRRVIEELKIFEGIQHKHLVRYYGLEIHREEMLLFMEFCAEGTLESLVAGTETGLPEAGVRRYTQQLLHAVNKLHEHGIGHRDVKSANIFLTDEGNCLKLGDFGSAVKIKAHTTMPGELQGFVGTQAYMAPEVFMKNNTEGHGRAADIWSVGCVVIEMASGKRPWAQFDSNYQIMFKVGMGELPEVPESLCREGQDFLELCLQHDPRQRSTAAELLCHSFVRIANDEDDSSTIPSILK